ncbi:uncharacterized protein LOC127854070 [Dreissena polymorpha]|uniref:G-protein coupled receptors family 1 profile domain-containing protein n=1 Tax=Dreissena polymorpha TaxID=45954 RepID=A0A9D4HRB2_DREPO|nr:uncharacterized protein LOC127854070 [Dreissena polymorpha]KAH3728140.1 hypothetical protein DPMN_054087 [Dreissena polymorpha]
MDVVDSVLTAEAMDRNDTEYNISAEIFPPMPPMMPENPLASFEKYALVITNSIGIVANLLIFYIFTRTKLKRQSTSRYLAAIAIADSGYLFTSMCISITKYNNIRIQNRIGTCQLISFGQYAFPFLIRWYLTAVVVEKYIGVMWPCKKSKLCTVFRAKCVIISLAVMAIVCYLYVTWFFISSGDPPICIIVWSDPRVRDPWQILTKMDAVVNFLVPYVIIFCLTCLIAYRSWIYKQRARSPASSERFLRRRRDGAEEKEFKTTPMLLLLVTCSLLFCIPNSTQRLRELSPNFKPAMTETDQIVSGLCGYFEVLNSAIRIFIYIIASNSFVRQLGRIVFCVGKCKQQSENTESQTCHMTNIDGCTTKSVATSTEGIV